MLSLMVTGSVPPEKNPTVPRMPAPPAAAAMVASLPVMRVRRIVVGRRSRVPPGRSGRCRRSRATWTMRWLPAMLVSVMVRGSAVQEHSAAASPKGSPSGASTVTSLPSSRSCGSWRRRHRRRRSRRRSGASVRGSVLLGIGVGHRIGQAGAIAGDRAVVEREGAAHVDVDAAAVGEAAVWGDRLGTVTGDDGVSSARLALASLTIPPPWDPTPGRVVVAYDGGDQAHRLRRRRRPGRRRTGGARRRPRRRDDRRSRPRARPRASRPGALRPPGRLDRGRADEPRVRRRARSARDAARPRTRGGGRRSAPRACCSSPTAGWGSLRSASAARPAEPALERELRHRGRSLGRIVLGARAPGEPYAPGDLALVEILSAQLALALDAVALATQLQISRGQIVTAHEEERRRLRRDLHDGLGPALAGIALTLQAAENTGGSAADDLVAGARAQLRTSSARSATSCTACVPRSSTISGWRRPSARTPTISPRSTVELDLPDLPVRLSAAAELAVYRIATEALTNVVRHAHAGTCRVALHGDREETLLEVSDDGRGLDPGAAPASACARCANAPPSSAGRSCSARRSQAGWPSRVRLPNANRRRHDPRPRHRRQRDLPPGNAPARRLDPRPRGQRRRRRRRIRRRRGTRAAGRHRPHGPRHARPQRHRRHPQARGGRAPHRHHRHDDARGRRHDRPGAARRRARLPRQRRHATRDPRHHPRRARRPGGDRKRHRTTTRRASSAAQRPRTRSPTSPTASARSSTCSPPEPPRPRSPTGSASPPRPCATTSPAPSPRSKPSTAPKPSSRRAPPASHERESEHTTSGPKTPPAHGSRRQSRTRTRLRSRGSFPCDAAADGYADAVPQAEPLRRQAAAPRRSPRQRRVSQGSASRHPQPLSEPTARRHTSVLGRRGSLRRGLRRQEETSAVSA